MIQSINNTQFPVTQTTSDLQPPTPPLISAIPNPKTNKPSKNVIKILALLGLLLVFVVAAVAGLVYFYNRQPTKRQDRQRKADITTIAQALEKSKASSLNASYYPSALTETTLVKQGYIEKIPEDPKNTAPFTYTYLGLPHGCTSKCTGYLLYACLENKNDNGENTTDPIAPCTTRTFQISAS